MSLQLFYGGFAHAADEATIRIDVNSVLNKANMAISRVVRWTISGTLLASGPVLTAAAQALIESAYSANYGDFRLVDLSSGLTIQSLKNDGSITGVRIIKPPSFPKGDGAEFATQRTYEIVAEAEYEILSLTELTDYSETVKYGGGGPLYGFVTCIKGPPKKVIMAEQTPYVATQSGYAIGRFTRPDPNPPLWPDYLTNNGEIELKSATRNGLSLRDFAVSWNYSFTSDIPLVANPTEWNI